MAGQWSVDYGDFRALQRAMQGADRDLYNAFRRQLRADLAKIRTDFREAWEPVENELAGAWGESKPIKGGKTNISTSVSNRSAKVTATKSTSMWTLNRGYVGHPLFGDRSRWFYQDVPSAKGWWDKQSEEVQPLLVKSTTDTLNDFADRLAAKIRTGTG